MKTLLKYMMAGVLLLGTAVVAQAQTTIRVTLQLPATHSLGQNWLAFKKIIEKESGGDLKLELFPSAQLYTDKQVPEAVGSGAIEAGSAFLGRFAGSVPAVEIVNLPFFFRDEAHLRAATANGSPMRKILDAAVLKETGVKVLWWQAFGRNIYLSKDKPIRVPSDFKGKKVRTYGKVLGWTVEALGGMPTLMSGSKQFLAYQQGAVDVGMTGVSAVKSRKLYEVMNNMTLSYDSAIEFVAVMNNDFFNSLSAKNQAIITKAAAIVEKQLRDQVYSGEAATVKELANKINIIRLTKAERKQWVKATSSVIDKFKAERGKIAVQAIKAAESL